MSLINIRINVAVLFDVSDAAEEGDGTFEMKEEGEDAVVAARPLIPCQAHSFPFCNKFTCINR